MKKVNPAPVIHLDRAVTKPQIFSSRNKKTLFSAALQTPSSIPQTTRYCVSEFFIN